MLNEKLDEYLKKNFVSFHTPGSKRSKLLRNDLAYKRDLTEINGFDNLNDPNDIFVSMQDKLANIYKVSKAIISTNGSTSGILSTIRALSLSNKNILIQRSSHKSVYNACELNQLNVSYIDICTDDNLLIRDINYDKLEDKLKNNNIGSVVVTSPSYEGFYLNLEKIYNLCKRYKAYLIVDMAHGSHLVLDNYYTNCFDVAITSFHKNLSALTPSSAILINNMDIHEEIKRNMAIFQTSSPSYLILESIDEMISKFDLFNELYYKLDQNLDSIYNIKLEKLSILDFDIYSKDKSKIIISTKNTNISGNDLAKFLRYEKIEVEMAYPSYILLITSIFNTKDDFMRLERALLKIDNNIKVDSYAKYNISDSSYLKIPQKKYDIYQTLNKETKYANVGECINKISASYVYAYPPGIPILIPGEIIDVDIIDTINFFCQNDILLNIKNNKINIINWQINEYMIS